MIIKDFHLPASAGEARDLLKRLGPDAVVIAGATSEIFLRGEQERVAVDITRTGMRGIRRDGNAFVVGATTSISDLQYHHEPGWVLDEVALRYVTQQIRNISTVGGNVARLELWADLPVALLVLGASVVVLGDTETTRGCDEFFSGPPAHLVEDGELVTAVRVPAVLPGAGFSYHKVVRANADYSTVTVAANMEADGSKARVVRVAIGGDRIPVRIKSIESALQGKPAGAEAFKDAVNAGVSGMKWFDAWGLTKDFIRNLATVHLNEVLAEAWARAKGGRS